MSDEAKVFRGDSPPEAAQVEPAATRTRAGHPPAAPAAAPASTAASEPTPADPPPPPVAPVRPPEAVAPPLDFHVDEIERWHAPEAVRQRLAQLASLAHETAHQLDEQAQEADRIARRLKSLKD